MNQGFEDTDLEMTTELAETPTSMYERMLEPGWLRRAHDRIAKNSGAQTPGVDGVTLKKFDERLNANLEKLVLELDDESFSPQAVRRVAIPKTNGEMRYLGILTIRDRIVQEAIRMLIEPLFEPGFSASSFGYRPGLSIHDAVDAVKQHASRKCLWVLEGDIEACFDQAS